MAKILVVEDDRVSQVALQACLEQQHVITCVPTCQEGLVCLKLRQFDLVILDWSLPCGSGLYVSHQVDISLIEPFRNANIRLIAPFYHACIRLRYADITLLQRLRQTIEENSPLRTLLTIYFLRRKLASLDSQSNRRYGQT